MPKRRPNPQHKLPDFIIQNGLLYYTGAGDWTNDRSKAILLSGPGLASAKRFLDRLGEFYLVVQVTVT